MFRRRRNNEVTRLFYAGDVHGSRLCWKKFVNAAAHYPAEVLVMGGDLTGKALVPIVREGDGTDRGVEVGHHGVLEIANEVAVVDVDPQRLGRAVIPEDALGEPVALGRR